MFLTRRREVREPPRTCYRGGDVETHLGWAVVLAGAAACTFLSLTLAALREYSLARFEELIGADGARMAAVRALIDREERLGVACRALRGVAMVVALGALAALAGLEAEAAGGAPAVWARAGLEYVAIGVGLFVVGGQTIPEAIGERRAERVLLLLRGPLRVLERLSAPLIWAFGGVATVTLRVAGVAEVDEKEEARDEILSAALAGESEGVIDEATKDVIENLMAFRDADVEEVMTPRIDMVSVELKDDLEAVLGVALEHEKSRLPVTDGSLDTVVGVLLVKDLLRAVSDRTIDWTTLMREPLFVPETKRVADLLVELRARKFHIAIVADEYGGTAGLVTIEDLIEEIIGEIDDEHDKEDLPVRKVNENLLDVDAKVAIDTINDDFGTAIPEDDDVETIGGFLALKLGRIPAAGDEVTLNGTVLRVTDADPRRAKRVLIKLG